MINNLAYMVLSISSHLNLMCTTPFFFNTLILWIEVKLYKDDLTMSSHYFATLNKCFLCAVFTLTSVYKLLHCLSVPSAFSDSLLLFSVQSQPHVSKIQDPILQSKRGCRWSESNQVFTTLDLWLPTSFAFQGCTRCIKFFASVALSISVRQVAPVRLQFKNTAV